MNRAIVSIVAPSDDISTMSFVESVSTDDILDRLRDLVPSLRPGTVVAVTDFDDLYADHWKGVWRFRVPADPTEVTP